MEKASFDGKLLIGSLDKVDFPDFALQDVACKIDTGAETSAIHCHRVRFIEKGDENVIAFKLLDPSHDAYNEKEFRTTNFEERTIKNSFGYSEERYVIKTTIVICGINYETEFTLADREHMKYPVLLGKRLLLNNFIVDVSEEYVSYRLKEVQSS